MPLIIPKTLPAYDALYAENIFVMHRERALSQHIRPLGIAILNLMPTKIATETQIARLLANSPLQVHMTLLQTASHAATHVSAAHLEAFYKTFDEVRDRRFDGMIITGAPVETIPFEQVDYWDELCGIMDWSKSSVYSTLHVCWGAQAPGRPTPSSGASTRWCLSRTAATPAYASMTSPSARPCASWRPATRPAPIC